MTDKLGIHINLEKPSMSAFAPITHTVAIAIPLVLREPVTTVLSSLPCQSTSHAASFDPWGLARATGRLGLPRSFGCPIHRPSGEMARPLGYKAGALNNLVVFAWRWGMEALDGLPAIVRTPCSRQANPANAGTDTAAKNSRPFHRVSSPISS